MIKPKETNNPEGEKQFTMEDAQELIQLFPCCKDEIDMEEFLMGLNVELEHGTKFADGKVNVTNDDGKRTAMIALAHLIEIPDYYTRLEKMEREAKAEKERAADTQTSEYGSDIIGPKNTDQYDVGDFLLKSTP